MARQSINPVRGSQIRATEASLSRETKPVTMDYRISGMKSYTPRAAPRQARRP
jgi:hypothetical protein